jgi:hypothetical protein
VVFYQQKPVIVDAVQWLGHNYADVRAWAEMHEKHHFLHNSDAHPLLLDIYMDGYWDHLKPGDYLVVGGLGDLSYQDQDAFERRYEPMLNR